MRTGIYIDPEIHQKGVKAVKRIERSFSWLVEKLIDHHVDERGNINLPSKEVYGGINPQGEGGTSGGEQGVD